MTLGVQPGPASAADHGPVFLMKIIEFPRESGQSRGITFAFWPLFWFKKCIFFRCCFWSVFGSILEAKMVPKWFQKRLPNKSGRKKRKNAKSLYLSLKINDFKVPLGPKTVQKITKIRIKILPKIMSEKISKNVSKNGPKMVQKWSKK